METKKQHDKIEKVMHEFKEGKLKSGKDGVGGKVIKRDQAVAIALSEAGLGIKRKAKK
jgi:hypothetical protein